MVLMFVSISTSTLAESPKIEDKKKTVAIELNAAEFVKRVHDFKRKPTAWDYVGDKPAIIDFYATWCSPCRELAPTLEALAAEYGDDIYVYKVDVDKEPDIARVYGIKSLPSLLFIPCGDVAPQMGQGNIPKASLEKVIDVFLLGKNVEEEK